MICPKSEHFSRRNSNCRRWKRLSSRPRRRAADRSGGTGTVQPTVGRRAHACWRPSWRPKAMATPARSSRRRTVDTLRRLKETHERRYLSIFGELLLRRCVYAQREKQQIERAPLDERLGLPAGEFSYVLEDWLQRMCVKESFHEATTSLRSAAGAGAQRAGGRADEPADGRGGQCQKISVGMCRHRTSARRQPARCGIPSPRKDQSAPFEFGTVRLERRQLHSVLLEHAHGCHNGRVYLLPVGARNLHDQ